MTALFESATAQHFGALSTRLSGYSYPLCLRRSSQHAHGLLPAPGVSSARACHCKRGFSQCWRVSCFPEMLPRAWVLQAQGSDIVKAAAAVHAGLMPPLVLADPDQPSQARSKVLSRAFAYLLDTSCLLRA